MTRGRRLFVALSDGLCWGTTVERYAYAIKENLHPALKIAGIHMDPVDQLDIMRRYACDYTVTAVESLISVARSATVDDLQSQRRSHCGRTK